MDAQLLRPQLWLHCGHHVSRAETDSDSCVYMILPLPHGSQLDNDAESLRVCSRRPGVKLVGVVVSPTEPLDAN